MNIKFIFIIKMANNDFCLCSQNSKCVNCPCTLNLEYVITKTCTEKCKCKGKCLSKIDKNFPKINFDNALIIPKIRVPNLQKFDILRDQICSKMNMISPEMYFENFLSEKEIENLKNDIHNEPWDNSMSRRVQHYNHKYTYTNGKNDTNYIVKKIEDVDWLNNLRLKIIDFVEENLKEMKDKFLPFLSDLENIQVIVNEYKKGQGISAHKDAPIFDNLIIGISICGDAKMIFKDRFKFFEEKNLKNGSIYFLHDKYRNKFTHEIPAKNIFDYRISITFRFLLKK